MYQFRSATKDDYELLVNSYLDHIERDDENAALFAKDLVERNRTIICLQEGIVSGSISWERRGGMEDGVAELTSLGVGKKYQRGGIARILVNKLIDEVTEFYENAGHKLRIIYLFMEKDNGVARAFYKHMKFKEVATIPRLYPHDDASIWVHEFQ